MNAETPISCRLKAEDQYVYHAELALPGLSSSGAQNINNNNGGGSSSNSNRSGMKRPAEEPQRVMKRRFRDDGHDGGAQEDEDMLDTPGEDEEEDNNLANQLPALDVGQQIPHDQQQDQQQHQEHEQQQQQQQQLMMPPPQQVGPGTPFDSTTDLPLPSPSASPKQTFHLDDPMDDDDTQVVQMETTKVIDIIERYAASSLTKNALNHLIFRLIQRADRSTLSDLTNTISGSLKRDFLTSLPTEISMEILEQLDHDSVNNVLAVSKSWNRLITSEFWKNLLIRDNYTTKEELDQLVQKVDSEPSIFHKLYTKRFRLHRNWLDPDFQPYKITVPGHGANVVTCLQFDDERIITGADDKMINIYDPETGKLLNILSGHEGGVWALKYIGNQIVSGSTDRTVRVWNIQLGKCTHVFKGHTSTIRCMEIVTNDEGEKFIITGSRDNTLHVWRLPDEDDLGEDYDETDPQNPYFVTVLRGHTASVRAVTGYGNTIISGSYDHTVRVWDLKTCTNKFVLRGHTDRIYSTILDVERNRCISASMDSTIRVWDLNNGACIAELTKHTSLVGLLGLSSNYLVSAAADGTLRGWNPDNYESEFVLHQDGHSAITTFYASPNLLVSGSEGQFNIYDLQNKGQLIRSNVLADSGPIWSAKFNYSKCVVAVEKNSQSFIEILDFSKRA